MNENRPASILYVDDDNANRLAFSMVLQHAGFQTREAATGTDALRLAAEGPDLIILDVNLPDIDGFEVCRRIKAHPATSSIPVLHMSAVYIRSEDKTHGLQGGADGYLTKPIEPDEVVATVHALLRIHRAEEAARAEARNWQATFDAITDAICLLDREGSVLRCNRAAAELFRLPHTVLVGRPYREVLEETFGPSAAALLAALLAAPPRRGEAAVEALLAGRWYRMTADPVHDESGGPAGSVHLLADVTPRKALEEQLRQAQKMEAVGQLASGVAHDFNNLLTGVTGNLTLALQETAADDPRREFLRAAEVAAWRAAELTQQLLGFSRQNKPRMKAVDLNYCVREAAELLRRTIGPAIEIVVRAADDLWLVKADAGQINQVLMNLCLNARDAMPHGGRLELETCNAGAGAAESSAAPGGESAEFVRLRVRDNGQGILADIQPRIYEPFFTTKEVGKGTGLGLAVVFGIVKEHRGWITCSSTPGEGACFDVYLPRFTPVT
jgi:two-component system, cell cycle sensor histidine kinase and response regulator CckA